MNRLLITLLCIAAAGITRASDAEQSIRLMDRTPAVLTTDEAQILYLSPGVVTTMIFNGKIPIGEITAGAPIIEWKKNLDNRRLDLWPTVKRGQTNLQVQLGNNVYTVILKIGAEGREPGVPVVQSVRHFSVDGVEASEDMERIASAPLMNPNTINASNFVQMIERAEMDSVYRNTLEDLRIYPRNRPYDWNDSFVRLEKVYAFVDKDLILLKVSFRNDTNDVIRFFADQIDVYVRGRFIQQALVYQRSAALEPACAVRPGEVDTAYLIIQGQKLVPGTNPFELQLPPDANAINAWQSKRNREGR